MPVKALRQEEICAVVHLNENYDALMQLRDEKEASLRLVCGFFPAGIKSR